MKASRHIRSLSIRHLMNIFLVFIVIYDVIFIHYLSSLSSMPSSLSACLPSSTVVHSSVQNVTTAEPSQPTSRSPTERYVTLSRPRMLLDRTGNHLFMLAAALHVASQTGRQLLMPSCGWPLDETFQLKDIRRYVVDYPCPCWRLVPPAEHFFNGDHRLDSNLDEFRQSTIRTIVLGGHYQTYRYVDQLDSTVRQMLRFRPEVRRAADKFIAESQPLNLKSEECFKVGFHVRRGDFLERFWRNAGATVISQRFVEKVVDYFRSRHAHVHFIVATDDWHWTKQTFTNVVGKTAAVSSQMSFNSADNSTLLPAYKNTSSVSLSFSEGHEAGVDLAILSSCDAVVVSSGSFGWWAAWLANKTTVYYANWPRPGSPMSKGFNTSVYFPPHWIPMT
jgi:galactoside 2-L-fucosyltransferase 1/2